MAGIPPWAAEGTDGGGQTIATNERPETITKTLEQTADVAGGSSQATTVHAPDGAVWNVRQVYLNAPVTDGTSGTHRFIVYTANNIQALEGLYDHDSQMFFTHGRFSQQANTVRPSNQAAQQQQMESLEATAEKPIEFRYRNDTDGPQTGKRVIKLLIEEVTY